MLNAIAIDDEPFALEVIRSHAGKVPFLQMDGYFTNPFEAIDYLAKNNVQLLFLDIKMPHITGMELMQSLRQKPMVIFTTAYAEHAVQSYEFDAVDYLLKPFAFPRFLKACHKAHDQLRHQQEPITADHIFIRSGYEQVRLLFEEILYLESAGNYMRFVLDDDRAILSRLTMTDALALLPPEQFVRVHRSYIVNRPKIQRAERHQLHLGSQVIPLSGAFSNNLQL
ncbi:response regulator transcription factor [Mucilaginibacter limnophilus]|uniref:Response regulator transcription factor n=1 Tax=Mucilaginibacter limnophilus TaxID=1932778 RepID=A0A437MRZ5_9SPHI|nr:LytTR family DNA-binding domain-containing protein [Mucilaginibacter limnophilus]RVU00429.1 response regulator transcription factor [Mucilaginibacter limnophilus]